MKRKRADDLMNEFMIDISQFEGGGEPLTPGDIDRLVGRHERLWAVTKFAFDEIDYLKGRLEGMELQRKMLCRVKRQKLFYKVEDGKRKRFKADTVEMTPFKNGSYFINGFFNGRKVGIYILYIERAVVSESDGETLVEFYADTQDPKRKRQNDPWLTLIFTGTEFERFKEWDPWFKKGTHYPIFYGDTVVKL